MKKIVDQKLQKGYTLDLGKLIEESFEYFKKTFLIGGLAFMIIGVAIVICYATLFGIIFGFGNFVDSITQLGLNASKPSYVIGNVVLTTIFSAIMAPLTAGFINLNHLARNNKEINVSNVFEFFKSIYFRDIFTAYLIIGFTNSVVSAISLLNPQNIVLSLLTSVFSGVVALFTIFVIPLIIYGEQNFSSAISKSISLFLKQPLYIILALIIAVIGCFLGFIALCIGIFFTFPYLYSMHYAIYEQAIGFEDKSQIEEIGLE